MLKGAQYSFTTNEEQFLQVNALLADRGLSAVEVDFNGDIIFSEYVPNTESTTILSNEDINELPTQTATGARLVDVSYSDVVDEGLWVGVYRQDAIPTNTFAASNYSDFITITNQQFGAGFGLIDLEYGDGTIVATYADYPNGRPNGTFVASENYDDFVSQVKDNTVTSPLQIGKAPYDIIDLEYIDGIYVGVLADFRGGSDYKFRFANYDEFQAEVQRQDSLGQTLVDTEYINGAWYGVFNDNQDIFDLVSEQFV